MAVVLPPQLPRILQLDLWFALVQFNFSFNHHFFPLILVHVAGGFDQVLRDKNHEHLVGIFGTEIEDDAAALELMNVSNDPMHHQRLTHMLCRIFGVDGEFISGVM